MKDLFPFSSGLEPPPSLSEMWGRVVFAFPLDRRCLTQRPIGCLLCWVDTFKCCLGEEEEEKGVDEGQSRENGWRRGGIERVEVRDMAYSSIDYSGHQ